MITKNDCMSILIDLEDRGIDIDKQMRKLMTSREVSLDVLKFIADNKGFEAANFYEVLRMKHNNSNSKLYTNIVSEIEDSNEIYITLSSLLTQIFLFAKKNNVSNKFFENVRANEITKALNIYITTEDNSLCLKLMKLIKSDLVVMEYLAGRRELE